MSGLRIYEPHELGADGYPIAWHQGIKYAVRWEAGDRCLRCGHPYMVGEHGSGEWSPCDERCTHPGPMRFRRDGEWVLGWEGCRVIAGVGEEFALVEAQWRILTVHHLNGNKADCRWWNLAALCQRCHLTIQGKVYMEREWIRDHSDWFKPYAAGWYAVRYLGLDLSREETMARLDELLALEFREPRLEGFPA